MQLLINICNSPSHRDPNQKRKLNINTLKTVVLDILLKFRKKKFLKKFISDRAAKMQQLNSVNKKNLQKIAEELSSDKKLRFDRTEIEKLLIKFTKLTTGNQKQLIDRNQFR